jgi:hypothetical protein
MYNILLTKTIACGKSYGVLRELNPGPPVPETGIIPLDQVPEVTDIAT